MAAIEPTPDMDEHRREQAALGGRIAATASLLVADRLNESNPDDGWGSLLSELLELIMGGRSISERLAMEFYEHLRGVEDAVGDAPAMPDVPFPTGQVAASMWYTGPRMAKAMVERGDDKYLSARVGDAVGRSAMRHTLNGGRKVIQGAVISDRGAWGWARVTDANPCDFCKMLATRGPVYKSAKTAGRSDLHRYHDSCGCSVVPVFWSAVRAQERGLPAGSSRGSERPVPRRRPTRGADGLTDRQRAVMEQVRRERESR